MEFRDVIHGSIFVSDAESEVIQNRFFQRLRSIKQLGFAEFSYPTACHNRYVHSLGAMHTASRIFDTVFYPKLIPEAFDFDVLGLLGQIPPTGKNRFRACLRLGALLHDIGHGPLSHTTEIAMPKVSEIGLPKIVPIKDNSRRSGHEDYTLKLLLDSDLSRVIEEQFSNFGITPTHVACLIDGAIETKDDFFHETIGGEKIDFRPILKQMISSEIDADRMDYLRRDNFYAGVSYGDFDFDWLLANLTGNILNGRCYLSIRHRALYTFEDFLISRYHMFLMVYFHNKSVAYDEMLAHFFNDPNCDYQIPSNIDEYCECDDNHLLAHLSKSKNLWAQRIANKNPFQLLIEIHSGIPAAEFAEEQQLEFLGKLKKKLTAEDIEFIESKSLGELSKYFRKPGDPLFVIYDNGLTPIQAIPLQECTNLFSRYEEKRRIHRVYVAPEKIKLAKKAATTLPQIQFN